MKKIDRRSFLKATGLAAAALTLSACGGSASNTAAPVSSTPASSTAASAASSEAASEAASEAVEPDVPKAPLCTPGSISLAGYTITAEYLPFDTIHEMSRTSTIHADIYDGRFFFTFLLEGDEAQNKIIYEYALDGDHFTEVDSYPIEASFRGFYFDSEGVLYSNDMNRTYDVDDPDDPGEYLSLYPIGSGKLIPFTDEDVLIGYDTGGGHFCRVENWKINPITLEGDRAVGPFDRITYVGKANEKLWVGGQIDKESWVYFFDTDGNQLFHSSENFFILPYAVVGTENGYLMWIEFNLYMLDQEGNLLGNAADDSQNNQDVLFGSQDGALRITSAINLDDGTVLALGGVAVSDGVTRPVAFRLSGF